MLLIDAKELCLEYINQYGIDYEFAWCNSTTYAGQCSHKNKQIRLSKPMMMKGTREQVTNTILHEIAHALTRGHGHDEIWRKKFIEMGGNGQRCSNYGVERKRRNPNKYYYEIKCPHCGAVTIRYRKPSLSTLKYAYCKCGYGKGELWNLECIKKNNFNF